MGYTKMEDWYNLEKVDVTSTGGQHLLTGHYNTSLVRLVKYMYPSHQWEPWKFKYISDPLANLGNPPVIAPFFSSIFLLSVTFCLFSVAFLSLFSLFFRVYYTFISRFFRFHSLSFFRFHHFLSFAFFLFAFFLSLSFYCSFYRILSFAFFLFQSLSFDFIRFHSISFAFIRFHTISFAFIRLYLPHLQTLFYLPPSTGSQRVRSKVREISPSPITHFGACGLVPRPPAPIAGSQRVEYREKNGRFARIFAEGVS
jgi:hypothetical protein